MQQKAASVPGFAVIPPLHGPTESVLALPPPAEETARDTGMRPTSNVYEKITIGHTSCIARRGSYGKRRLKAGDRGAFTRSEAF